METGIGSKFQLTRLAAKYNQIQKDGRILSNRHSMEIVRERIRQLAERIDLNEAPERMKKIKALWEDMKDKRGRGKELEAREVEKLIDDEFESAYHDYASWKQMFDALDLDRKMVESEVKIMKDLKAIMTAEDGYELMAKVLASIITAVDAVQLDNQAKDRLLKRVQYEIRRIVGDELSGETGRGLGGGEGEIIEA